jgi:hypothetical protein
MSYIICIDDDYNPYLTKGKKYEELHEFTKVDMKNPYHEVDIFCTIIDDSGFIEDYKKSQFITVEEFRDNKLKDIGL